GICVVRLSGGLASVLALVRRVVANQEVNTMRRYARFLGLTLLLGLGVVPAVEASNFSVQIRVARPVVASPGGHLQPARRRGAGVGRRCGYRWVPGHWVAGNYYGHGYGDRDRDRYRHRGDWDRDGRRYRR